MFIINKANQDYAKYNGIDSNNDAHQFVINCSVSGSKIRKKVGNFEMSVISWRQKLPILEKKSPTLFNQRLLMNTAVKKQIIRNYRKN